MRRYNDMIQDMTQDMTQTILTKKNMACEESQRRRLNRNTFLNTQGKSPRALLCSTLLVLLMFVGVSGVKAQPFTVTTDTDNSGTIEESEKHYYFIQSGQVPTFYWIPDATNTSNVNTTNVPSENMLWYFLDAGIDNGTQYYYIVHRSGKYLYKKNDSDGGIQLTSTAPNSDNYKFRMEAIGSFFFIRVKGSNNYVNKKSGNVNKTTYLKNSTATDNNSQWKFIATDDLSWEFPFDFSTANEKNYYKIKNESKTSFYISLNSTQVCTSNAESDDNMVWYFEQVPTEKGSNNYITYCYIVNAVTGKYMHFDGTVQNNSQDNACSVQTKTNENETRCQFIIVRSAKTTGSGNNIQVIECYAIIPRLLQEKVWNHHAIGQKNETVGTGVRTYSDRGGTNDALMAQWNFVEFSATCESPNITYSSETGKVSITTETSGAIIHYTTDGMTVPSSTVGTPYEGPFDITEPTTIMAIATKTAYNPSVVATVSFSQVATPIIQYDGNVVSITCATEDATIYYTLDGNPPTTSSTEYTSSLTGIQPGVTIKAIAVRNGMINSAVASLTLEIIPDAPTITEYCDNTFSLSCNNLPSAAIYYNITTNGDTPTDPTTGSTLYDGTPISFDVNYKIKAISYYNNQSSTVLSYTFEAVFPAAPVITLAANTATITTSTSGAVIYYTTDGSDPSDDTNQARATYSSGVTISENSDVVIRAVAVKNGKTSCEAQVSRPAIPSLTVTNPSCDVTNQITITANNDGRTLWYAYTAGENSAAPAKNTFTQYNGVVSLNNLSSDYAYYTIHAYAKSSDGNYTSDIVSVSHQMKTPGTPTLTEPTGSSNALDISNGTVGDKVICSYTDNNGTPDNNTDDYNVTDNSTTIGSDRSAIFYIPNTATGTITVSFKRGEWQTSCEATYSIPGIPPTPTWSQDSDNRLSLSCTDGMAVIHYTTDGFEPTMSSPTYSVGCLYNIEVGTTIKAIAVKGFRISSVMTYTYQHTHVAAPEFFVEGNQVTITAPDGATIYYTVSTNGNNNESETIAEPVDPTAIPANLYNEAYTLTGITKIKAIAVKDGLQNSNIASITTREGYTIDGTDEYPLSLLNDPNLQGKYFFLSADFTAPANYTSVTNFTGVLVGNNHTISGLTKPLFATATGAVIHDLNLKDVTINEATGNAGAIAKTAAGDTRIYNCGILPTTADGATNSTISGAAYVGSLVGELTDEARVINCFSYANITGGTHRAGIVGYNGYASTTKSNDLKTMIMNCMYYGNISTQGSTAISPIYGGDKISNAYTKNVTDGLDNFNYFYFNRDYVSSITDYNCALGAEERFLNRFEFFRQTLNSTRDLAAWYVSGTVDDKELMGKWVLDKKIAPYPILKAPGVYPSVTNPDAKNAQPIDANNEYYNKGRKLGTITVTLSGTGITTASLTLNITDKDPDNFNFNYKKIQLPYFNEVGTGNYTNNMVVTGWKITNITPVDNDPYSSEHYTGTNYDAPYYNFVDRKSSNKDLFSVSGRIFNQGAYWEVPDNVSSITIEPVWAECVYLADLNYDVTYEGKSINLMGDRDLTSQLGNQTVYNDINTALSNLGTSATSVYDYAIVLVGNYHHSFGSKQSLTGERTAPLTIMSADFDNDNEPDCTFFYNHADRANVAPIRFDFINIPGRGMVQKADGAQSNYQAGIFRPTGWFEITNTVNIYFSQFEYSDNQDIDKTKVIAPVILQGGVYEQFVSARYTNAAKTQYLLVGGNAWFKNFANGCHTNKAYQTPKIPINVAGGEYENFYLSGIYQPNLVPTAENAECYIDGGKFGEVAGAGMQRINGNVTWLINGADITRFYGGGINAGSPISGNISTTISNSRVGEFCGGPKFGNMAGYNTAATNDDKTVTTIATNCDFTTFFGAGHGGTSINRIGVEDKTYKDVNFTEWDSWVSTYYLRSYQTNQTINIPTGTSSEKEVKAISIGYEYDYIFYSGAASKDKVARFFVNFASMDLANTNSVTSTLTKCKIGTFYGGGKMGAVNGNATSTLTECTVTGNAYGAGFSAVSPTVDVTPRENSDGQVGFEVAPSYNNSAGVFNSEQAKAPDAVTYTWDDNPNHFADLTTSYFNDTDHLIFTGWTKDSNNEDVPISLQGLGKVNGNASLTINGKSVIGTLVNNVPEGGTGNVFGGGELSSISGNTSVSIADRTKVYGDVYGGGKGKADTFTCDKAMVGDDGDGIEHPEGGTTVSISNGTIEGSVYGGGYIARVEKNTNVTIGLESGASTPLIKGYVYGGGKGVKTHGYSALVRGNPSVTIQGDAKIGKSVYGGGEIASVARYQVGADGKPHALAETNGNPSGYCTVIIRGNAEIGPDDMKMYHEGVNAANDKPDDYGHVFGAGRGILPDIYSYADTAHKPKRMMTYNSENHTQGTEGTAWEYCDPDNSDRNDNVWEYFPDTAAYHAFLRTLALSTQTGVTIGGNAFVKGSVYGGSENGLVQYNTYVTIEGNCQIGNGDGVNRRYTDSEWSSNSPLAECAHWIYGLDTNNDGKNDLFAPYDPYANATGDLDKYPSDVSTEGGRRIATDGHSFYGNVFGGGSGSIPYYDNVDGVSKYLNNAGTVKGNTNVTISGGHILTSVYGGCEATNVLGTSSVTMTGGTLGVPRNEQQIKDHPVTCYLFGGGKGDQRIFFNKDTNVKDAIVNVTGGTIYGSVLGGGEDGHVLRNSKVTIGNNDGTGPKIGTFGTTYLDGNVFGGGRGFGGEALTAGNVGGAVDLTIKGGEILGSVYGGGRLASVGYGLYLVDEVINEGQQNEEVPYGKMRADNEYDGSYPNPSSANPEDFFDKGRGHITVTISGGTIGINSNVTGSEHSGNVFGGSMGRLDKLDGSPFDSTNHWSLLATAKTTNVIISGGTINRSVYGGGELGTVSGYDGENILIHSQVTVSGGTILGSVFGGGYGSDDDTHTFTESNITYSPIDLAGKIKGSTKVNLTGGTVANDLYGGGALASVGGNTTVNLFGGAIYGDAYGGGLGQIGREADVSNNIDAITAVAAIVGGNVTVNLGDPTEPENADAIATAFITNPAEGGANHTHTTSATIDQTPYTGIQTAGRIFGCNNQNGTPKDSVTINVWRTYHGQNDKPGKTAFDVGEGTYEVAAVYGGGNLATYDPTNPETKTQVNIYGCGLTSIKYVYGGGNAAPVPASEVNVEGTYEIYRVFGGGNGKDPINKYGGANDWELNPGADVGIKPYTGSNWSNEPQATKALLYSDPNGEKGTNTSTGENIYVMYADTSVSNSIIGTTKVSVYGGTIHDVFGGSNTKGDIIKKTNVKVGDDNLSTCILNVGGVYGGSNEAYMSGETDLDLTCTEGTKDIFGGSYGAVIGSDVHLKINSGHYERVFGGNNSSNAVKGSITVTIEENGCLPVEIDELYGGGYDAPYSIYGYYEDGNHTIQPRTKAQYDQLTAQQKAAEGITTPYADPRINIISATKIGKIFGGGYGPTAVMVGSPRININMQNGTIDGTYQFKEGKSNSRYDENDENYYYKELNGTTNLALSSEGNEGDATYFTSKPLPLGSIGDVFGGGNNAEVIGSTYVEIGTGQWLNSNGVVEMLGDDTYKYTYEETANSGTWYKWTDPADAATKQAASRPTPARNAAQITGEVYGGGNNADVKDNTNVTIGDLEVLNNSHLYIQRNVYGGGKMGSVGTITNLEGIETSAYKHYDPVLNNNEEVGVYGFGLSWPYELIYKEGTGTATVYINGGRIGISGKDNFGKTETKVIWETDNEGNYLYEQDGETHQAHEETVNKREDNGDVYGGSKGNAGGVINEANPDRYKEALIANVRETKVYINLPTPTIDNIGILVSQEYEKEKHIMEDKYSLKLADGLSGIAGSVYGGGEDGHVYENTLVNITGGYIGHGVYGGGKGKGTYKGKLKSLEDGSLLTEDTDIPSWIAGKVFGNTEVVMSGGLVMRNIYGGGNLGSVGKGNYASGQDDYYPGGYGEKLNNENLWTSQSDYDNAWHFLHSGKASITITGGTIGYEILPTTQVTDANGTSAIDPTKYAKYSKKVSMKDDLPTGNVFGGSRGQAAADVGSITPRYMYAPAFYLGYVNETEVIIGNEDGSGGPRIFGSIYGGGQDGHVRRDANVTIYGGEIGIPYDAMNQNLIGTSDLQNDQWLHRGNVYGAGSGIGKYEMDLDGDEEYEDDVYITAFNGKVIHEISYGTSAGSVTRFTNVTIGSGITGNSGTETPGNVIYHNVYGGGSLASIGPPKIPPTTDDPFLPTATGHTTDYGKQTLTTVNIAGAVGHSTSYAAGYGGNVYGSSRGASASMNLDVNSYATNYYSKVNVNGGNVIGDVFGGGEAGLVTKDSYVSVSNASTIGNNLFGGGDKADVQGNTYVSITGGSINHNVYGGGNLGDIGKIVKNTTNYNYKWTNETNPGDNYTYNNTGACNVTISGGTIGTTSADHVFGGGKGDNSTFWCEKGMAYSTNVSISNGTVNGNVYGGGQIARVESLTAVTLGTLNETGDGSKPDIKGSVFGAGQGIGTHGYSALVRGNPVVTIQGVAKVGGNVYGGGEIASVGKHNIKNSTNATIAPPDLPMGMPFTLANTESGKCTVTIQGSAQITGNVFGAGKGIVPEYVASGENRSKRMMTYSADLYNDNDRGTKWDYSDDSHGYVWEYFADLDAYLKFVRTLALTTDTKVTINGTTINGSVYGGSENGFVQYNTDVEIKGNCQIGTQQNNSSGYVFGGGLGLASYSEAGIVNGATNVTITGGNITRNVYGGGEMGAVANSSRVVIGTAQSGGVQQRGTSPQNSNTTLSEQRPVTTGSSTTGNAATEATGARNITTNRVTQ